MPFTGASSIDTSVNKKPFPLILGPTDLDIHLKSQYSALARTQGRGAAGSSLVAAKNNAFYGAAKLILLIVPGALSGRFGIWSSFLKLRLIARQLNGYESSISGQQHVVPM
jgi:hypothetical protein